MRNYQTILLALLATSWLFNANSLEIYYVIWKYTNLLKKYYFDHIL